MLMSVFERTHELGVLRAVGWSSWRVVRLILTESLALALLSTLAGVAIGMGLNMLLQFMPLYGDFLDARYTLADFVRVLLMAVGFGLMGGLLPAWRALRLSPIAALREE
jgi:ABC-type antimicrobial peptide transport system permease subunit